MKDGHRGGPPAGDRLPHAGYGQDGPIETRGFEAITKTSDSVTASSTPSAGVDSSAPANRIADTGTSWPRCTKYS